MSNKTIKKFIFPLSDSLEIEINGKLIYSKKNLGEDPNIEEIVEITKWGHQASNMTAHNINKFKDF